MQRLAMVGITLALAGCASQPVQQIAYEAPIPSQDALYRPERIQPGRLEYAADRDTFAPILTHQGPYPTQQQANYAYHRAIRAATYSSGVVTKPVRTKPDAQTAKLRGRIMASPKPHGIAAPTITDQRVTATSPTSIHLFACKPGLLDGQTARVTDYDAPVVHCATDFLDVAGVRLSRETINFYYYQNAWHIDFTNPPRRLVPWLNRFRSPKDRWSWMPGRDRYQ